MENGNTQTITGQSHLNSFTKYEFDNELSQQRLDALLTINAETDREKAMFRNDREKYEADLMKNPINTKQTYAYLGLLLGTLTPTAIFARFLFDSRSLREEDLWIIGVLSIVNVISAIVGYFSGKAVGKIVNQIESLPWWAMIAVLPFVGLIWGIVSGGAGGIIIFVFGAIFGAILGGTVGCIALPIFTIFHRLLKKGEDIERKHFLPLAFGITFVICGFILGL